MQCFMKVGNMALEIPVHLRHKNTVTLENDHLLPTTTAELVTESDDRMFVSKKEKQTYANKQDKLGYVPVNQAGGTMTGPLILSGDAIQSARQAATKQYVDQKIAELVNGSPAALDTIYELAAAIGNDPNFAVTISSVAGSKINQDAAASVATPNKLLYLDGNGELSTNAASASRLKDSFTLELTGDVSMAPVSIDGSRNVTGSLYLASLSEDEVETIFNQT